MSENNKSDDGDTGNEHEPRNPEAAATEGVGEERAASEDAGEEQAGSDSSQSAMSSDDAADTQGEGAHGADTGEAEAHASGEGAERGETPATADADESAAQDGVDPAAVEAGDRGAGGESPAGSGGAGSGGGRRRWLVPALIILVIVALGAAGGAGGYWLEKRLRTLEDRVDQVPQQREQALARFARSDALAESITALEGRLKERLGKLQKRVDAVAQEGADRSQGLRERLDKLEEAVATARELAGRDQLDWRLAEVHYLVAVAARRLSVAHDRRSAIAALEAADRSLAAVGDVRLVDLRERLIDDIARLRQIEPADVEGIALRIQSLVERLPDLPQRSAPDTQQASAAGDGAGGGTGWWQRLRQRLSHYIIIRRQAGDSGPVRPRAQGQLPVPEKLAYALTEARRAALRREPEPYEQAVGRAQELLSEHYGSDGPTVAHFANTLAQLSERTVVTDYPDLTQTLDVVERTTSELEARRQRPDVIDAPGQGKE